MIMSPMIEVKKVVTQQAPEAKVVLFGSRARGDANSDSDWDVLILVDREGITAKDFQEINYPIFDIGFQIGQYISPKLYTFKEWEERKFTPFYKNIEKEGIVI